MIDNKKMPQKGTMYALYRSHVDYQKYDMKTDSVVIDEKELLELHMFDSEKEYRVVRSEVRGMMDIVVDDSCVHDDIYEETVATYNGGKVTIVNYITYTEEDTLTIHNYRLKEV